MTTPTYKDLLKQRDELAAQIEEARKREVGDAVAKVRTIIAEYELTPDQVFAPPNANALWMVMPVQRSNPNTLILKPKRLGQAVVSLPLGLQARIAAFSRSKPESLFKMKMPE